MRIRRPSPAMVVALVALFVSLGGTSVAAVSFARNAGAVDGKSAVFSGATLNQAAGKLVATNRSGADKGRIPGKFVADVARTETFGRAFDVPDNQALAPTTMVTLVGLGTLSTSCNDQNAAPGVEDPRSTISFANQSGGVLNFARRVGNGDGSVGLLPNGVADTFAIAGSNTFTYHVQKPDGTNLLVNGVVRQDGRGAATASCLVFGSALILR